MTPLRKRLTDDLTHRNRSPDTFRADVYIVAQYAQCCCRSPDQLGSADLAKYLCTSRTSGALRKARTTCTRPRRGTSIAPRSNGRRS